MDSPVPDPREYVPGLTFPPVKHAPGTGDAFGEDLPLPEANRSGHSMTGLGHGAWRAHPRPVMQDDRKPSEPAGIPNGLP